MAVTFVIGNTNLLSNVSLLSPGNSITSAIANEFAEAGPGLHTAALMELGLILFFITFVVLTISILLVPLNFLAIAAFSAETGAFIAGYPLPALSGSGSWVGSALDAAHGQLFVMGSDGTLAVQPLADGSTSAIAAWAERRWMCLKSHTRCRLAKRASFAKART